MAHLRQGKRAEAVPPRVGVVAGVALVPALAGVGQEAPNQVLADLGVDEVAELVVEADVRGF